MELQFLGTGAGQPAKQRNVSSLVLKLLDEINEVWMFDCGEGTQRQILETTIKPRKIKKILSPTCMAIIFLAYQDFCPAVRFRLVKSKRILIFTALWVSKHMS